MQNHLKRLEKVAEIHHLLQVFNSTPSISDEVAIQNDSKTTVTCHAVVIHGCHFQLTDGNGLPVIEKARGKVCPVTANRGSVEPSMALMYLWRRAPHLFIQRLDTRRLGSTINYITQLATPLWVGGLLSKRGSPKAWSVMTTMKRIH